MDYLQRIGTYGKEKVAKKAKSVATTVRRQAAKLSKKKTTDTVVSNSFPSVTANNSTFNNNGQDVVNIHVDTVNVNVNNSSLMTPEQYKELFRELASDADHRFAPEFENEGCKLLISDELRKEMQDFMKQNKSKEWVKQLAKVAKKWKKIHWPGKKRTNKLPKCDTDERKAILYLVQANEPLTVKTVFSGGTEFTWHYNCVSVDQARFTQTIHAQDNEEIVLLYVYGNGCRDITRVRKDSDHHLQIFKDKGQVVPIYYDNGQTVVATNFQTDTKGCSLNGRKYQVTGELHKQGQLFGKHFTVTADNCHIIESEGFERNREEMLRVCPDLQDVYNLVDAQRADRNA